MHGLQSRTNRNCRLSAAVLLISRGLDVFNLRSLKLRGAWLCSLAALLGGALLSAQALAASSREVIARGEYLARAGDCIACHTVPAGKLFGGGRPMETPFGTLFTPNISSDKESGIGKWSADEFYRMMHTGKS